MQGTTRLGVLQQVQHLRCGAVVRGLGSGSGFSRAGRAFGTTFMRPKGTTGRTASRVEIVALRRAAFRARATAAGERRRRRDRDFPLPAGTHQLLRVLRGQPVQEELIQLELGRGEFVHVRHLDVPLGSRRSAEGKGRSRQDERHNVQNEARCDPAEARSPRGDARDAPEVSISGTLCSPLTLSPAIAPATGVTHSGAQSEARRQSTPRMRQRFDSRAVGTQSAISNSETS